MRLFSPSVFFTRQSSVRFLRMAFGLGSFGRRSVWFDAGFTVHSGGVWSGFLERRSVWFDAVFSLFMWRSVAVSSVLFLIRFHRVFSCGGLVRCGFFPAGFPLLNHVPS
jgi:hypothetical protein